MYIHKYKVYSRQTALNMNFKKIVYAGGLFVARMGPQKMILNEKYTIATPSLYLWLQFLIVVRSRDKLSE